MTYHDHDFYSPADAQQPELRLCDVLTCHAREEREDEFIVCERCDETVCAKHQAGAHPDICVECAERIFHCDWCHQNDVPTRDVHQGGHGYSDEPPHVDRVCFTCKPRTRTEWEDR